MNAKNHKDYEIENEKLKEVISSMSEERDLLMNRDYSTLNQDIAFKKAYEDVKKIDNINKYIDKPYFGRIDFKKSNSENIEKLYIGKTSVFDLYKDDSMLVIDWRSPVASLYYESGTQDVSYIAPEGEIKGDISLRRNYKIEERILKDITDVNVNTIDEMLNAALNENKDTKLKDIVATIQEEQNNIIRSNINKDIIVQGVAGSGKTTIALHRMAYLMYLLNNKVKPNEFMIIAPNKLFLNYISDVLPDLGVEDALQTTMEELAQKVSRKKNLNFLDKTAIDMFSNDKNSNRYQISKFKTSMKYKYVLDEYFRDLIKSKIKEEDFIFNDFTIMTKERVELLLSSYKDASFNKKIKIIHEHMKKTFDENLDQIKINISNKTKNYIKNNEGCNKKEVYEEENKIIKNLNKTFNKEMNKYISQIKETIYDIYVNLFKCKNNLKKYLNKHLNQEINESFYLDIIESSKDMNLEDIPGIMYLSYLIDDIEEHKNIKYIMIDEAQDFSEFQIYVLKKMYSNAKFNLYGDLAQGINEYRGTKSWLEVNKVVFKDDAEIKHIVQSYRTTYEIMQFANQIIAKEAGDEIKLAKPILRYGKDVEIIKKEDMNEITKDIVKNLKDEINEYKSIAIICKDLKTCKKYYEYIKSNINQVDENKIKVELIDSKDKIYDANIVIVPIYLVKGLEFDLINVVEVDNDTYKENTLDVKLLYVAFTRALHRLKVYYKKELSALIK